MIKAIIFDFDGTLADTLPICYHAFQQVFKTFDKRELSDEEVKAMFGPSETGIIRENLRHKDKAAAIELFYKSYTENHEEFVKPNKQIADMIAGLKEKGFQVGIVTGKARRSLDISLEALGIDLPFDVVLTGDDVTEPKPHPEGIKKALTILGVSSEEAMYLGDSDADIEAGKQSNVRTAGVQWLPEFQTSEFTVKPDAIFASVSEFLESIK
ncbi:HAD family hydrolase [Lentibacillus sediminis]|uniref:HAD family hydrolase n=1 Tax=Lentibacillus sediminis TaxID=1940529 RepID=UPI000C1BF281|nr:HAD family hydrolase [Lentibacillus sediminis]